MTPTEIRLALRRNGFHPLPVEGKIPPLKDWEKKFNVSDDEICFWSKTWHLANNTGIIAKFTPGLDIDILDPDAAKSVEDLAREHFEERGDILIRIGLAPKRLIPLRTDEPFPKLKREFIAPNGQRHQIEILGDGQQWVACGVHEGTGKPYGWYGGNLETIARDALPYVRREDMQRFLNDAVRLLDEQFGFVLKDMAADDGNPHDPGEPQASIELIAATLAVIPNDIDWDGWNAIGMATWRATGGSAAGFVAFDTWSRKSPKYDAQTTAARWAGYFKSPPTQIGAGTLFHLADRAAPRWRPTPEPPPWLDDPPPLGPDGPPRPRGDESELGEWDAGDDPGPIPPRQWLLGNQFCRCFISSIVAPGGIGKTAVRLLQLISLALGRSLCGQHVFRRCRVLLISLEDDRDEVQRRIQAILNHFQISRADLKGWLFVATPRNVKLAELKDRKRVIGPLQQQIRAAIARCHPDIVSLDPFIKSHGLAENDSGDMDFVCDLLAALAHDYQIAVDSPHHTHKGQIRPGDADSGRGASGIRDAGRLVYTLTPMSETEATNFKISPDDRYSYVRLDSAKVNITARDGNITWFHLTGVPIGNATPDYPKGDTIQVAEPWQPPDEWAGLSTATLNAILNEIAVGIRDDNGQPTGERFSNAPRAKGRAVWQVFQRFAPEKTEPQCRTIIRAWLKSGVLYEEEYYSGSDYKDRSGLFVDAAKRSEKETPPPHRDGRANSRIMISTNHIGTQRRIRHLRSSEIAVQT